MRLRHVTVRTQGTYQHVRLSGAPLSLREALELEHVFDTIPGGQGGSGVVLVDSAGPDFCPGPAPDLDPLGAGCDPAAAIARCTMPVVVAVRGRTASVGLELALAADLRIGDGSARFAFPDVALGRLPCWGGTQRLPRVVGRGTAARMLLAGAELDAGEALRAGLLNELTDGVLDPAAAGLAERLGALPPLALAAAKEAMTRGPELPMRRALELEGDLNHLLQTSADRAEGLAAFFAKRPGVFHGE
jgi:enoyl-CoA hydratase